MSPQKKSLLHHQRRAMSHTRSREIRAVKVDTGEVTVFPSVYSATVFAQSQGFLPTESKVDGLRHRMIKWADEAETVHGYRWIYGNIRSARTPKHCCMRRVETGEVHSFQSHYGATKKLIDLGLVTGIPGNKVVTVSRWIKQRKTKHGYAFFPCETPDDGDAGESSSSCSSPLPGAEVEELASDVPSPESSICTMESVAPPGDVSTYQPMAVRDLTPPEVSIEDTTRTTADDVPRDYNISSTETYTFTDEVDSIFQGNGVRIFDGEDEKLVSVFDVVAVVTKCTNPRMTIARIYEEYPELKDDVKFVQFNGQGQRQTPVMNSQAFIELVQVLPGKTAARFRRKGAAVLARYLRGDVTLIPEIAGNAANTSAATELFPAPSDHTNRLFRIQRLEAERHAGASIGDFGYQPCVYVLNARVNDCDVVKVGSTNDIVRRVGEHLQDLDIQSVYSVIPCDMAFKLERNVHDRLRPYQMKGVRGLELYQGVTAEHADTVVTSCAGELHAYLASKYGSPGVSEAQRMEHELRMKQMDVEATHAETKRLEMVLKLKEVGSQLAT